MDRDEQEIRQLPFVCWYVMVLPPLSAAVLLCRTCRRNLLDWRWPMLGCGLLAIVVGCFESSYRIASAPGDGMLSFGCNFQGSASWLTFSFLPKFVAAMGIGLLLVKRAQMQFERVQETAGA